MTKRLTDTVCTREWTLSARKERKFLRIVGVLHNVVFKHFEVEVVAVRVLNAGCFRNLVYKFINPVENLKAGDKVSRGDVIGKVGVEVSTWSLSSSGSLLSLLPSSGLEGLFPSSMEGGFVMPL